MTPNDLQVTWSYFKIQDENDQDLFNKVNERLDQLSKKTMSNGNMDTIVYGCNSVGKIFRYIRSKNLITDCLHREFYHSGEYSKRANRYLKEFGKKLMVLGTKYRLVQWEFF